MNLPPPPFVGGAHFAQVHSHPPPPAPPPAPPVPLPEMERLCTSAADEIASQGGFASYQAVASRVCASRGVAHLAQLGVSHLPRALERIWRAQQLIDAHVVSYVGARFVACLTDLERDLVLLLDAYHLRPTGADRVTNPEEIDIDESEDERADETENASSFASFGLGPLTSVPAVRHYFALTGTVTNEHTAGTCTRERDRTFIDGATCAALLASFLENGVEKRLRTGEAFAAYLLENASNRRFRETRIRETDGKKPTNRQLGVPVTSLAELGVRVAGGPIEPSAQTVVAGHVASTLRKETERAEHETRAADAAADAARRSAQRAARPPPPPRLREPSDARARAFVVACERALEGPWRPSRGKLRGLIAARFPDAPGELLGAAAEFVALHLGGGKARAAMFEAPEGEPTDAGLGDAGLGDAVRDEKPPADVTRGQGAAAAEGDATDPDASTSEREEEADPVSRSKRPRRGAAASPARSPPPADARASGEATDRQTDRPPRVFGAREHASRDPSRGPSRVSREDERRERDFATPFEGVSRHERDEERAAVRETASGAALAACAPWRCDASDARAVGRWGEALVYNYLLATRPGWTVTWLNEREESLSFYDVKLESPVSAETGGRRTIFVEVKTTRSRDKNVFEMSPNEWSFASRPGVDYRVYRVFSAGDADNVRLTVVRDPFRSVNERAVALCLAI